MLEGTQCSCSDAGQALFGWTTDLIPLEFFWAFTRCRQIASRDIQVIILVLFPLAVVVLLDEFVTSDFLADRGDPREPVGEVGWDTIPKAGAHKGDMGKYVYVRDGVLVPHSVASRPGLL